MSYELSAGIRDKIEHWKARFPEDRQRSAVIAALHAVQHENKGWLTAEQMNAVAEYLDLPTIQVYEVATFYSMFQTKEVGRNEVSICTNVSCMLRGRGRHCRTRRIETRHQAGRKHRRRQDLPEARRRVYCGLLRRAIDAGQPQIL